MTIREWWRRRRYCPACGAPWIVGEESERVSRSGDLRVVERPHLFLVCPEGHERRQIDEYAMRCQEWLLYSSEASPLIDAPERSRDLCRCPPGTAVAEQRIEVIRREVAHKLGVVDRHNLVEFSFPIATCGRCGRPRSIADDFDPCWAQVDLP
jgi:hypothetical protein